MLLKKKERLPSVDASCGFDSSDAIVGGADRVRPNDFARNESQNRKDQKNPKIPTEEAKPTFQKRKGEKHNDHYHFAEPHMWVA